MKNEAYILENKYGQTARTLFLRSEKLYVVYLLNTHRVEFVNDLDALKNDGVEFQLISEITRKELKKGPVKIGDVGFLKLVEDDQPLRDEVQLPAEDKKNFPIFLKYSAIAHVSVLLLILISAWIIGRFFKKAPEPIMVQVFTQARPVEAIRPTPTTVAPMQRKIHKQKVKVAQVFKNKKVIARTRNAHGTHRSTRAVVRPGVKLNEMGALSVLGGMAKNFHGGGGLNVNAKNNNSGIGYGGSAQRGGNERGMLGKGLVATGIGNGGSLQGYGGLGTRGQGGGRPGYGRQKMAGSSAAYFEPLGEDPIVEGGLDQDQINAVIQRHIGQVIYCYEQGLQSSPRLSGRVAVKFVIGGVGSVNSAGVASSSLSSKNVESCIVNKLRGWKFPRPVGNVNVRVTYPFMLKRLSQG